jgi:hypothetical protein
MRRKIGPADPSLYEHLAEATVTQNFKIRRTADKPLTIPTEAAGPKAEYLEYHRISVFDRS